MQIFWKCFVGAIGFLCCSFPLLSQSPPPDIESRLKSYDLKFCRLEVKLSEEVSRIAGQQEMYFEVNQPMREYWVELGAHLKVAQVSVDGKRCRFDRQEEYLQIYLPLTLRIGESHHVSIIYGGDLIDRFAYPVWEATGSKVQVALDPNRIEPRDWFPCKQLYADPLDSLYLQVIFPFGTEIVASGSRRWQVREPGEFVMHAFKKIKGVMPEDVYVFAGNVDRLSDQYMGKNGPCNFSYFIQAGDVPRAKQHLAQIKRIFRSLEDRLGPDPKCEQGYSWFQPLPENFNSINQNRPDIQLVADVSQRWLSEDWFPNDTLANWFRRAFTYYAAGLVVEDWQSPNAAATWLLDTSAHFRSEAAILHTLRMVVDNDEQWFAALKGCLSPNPSYPSLPAYFSAKLGQDIGDLFVHYLTVDTAPMLTYRLVGNKRKQAMQYRWTSAPSGFNLPVVTMINGSKYILYPTEKWQSLSLKGISEKHFVIEPVRGWFNLQRDPIDR